MSRSRDSCVCCLVDPVHPAELAAVVVAVGVLFASAELLRRRGVSSDATRRYTHSTGGMIAAVLPAVLSLGEYLGLALVVAAVLAWTRARGLLGSVHGVERPTLGATLFPLGLAIAATFSWSHPAAYGLGVMTFALADPAAATVGERVGSPRWAVWRGTKSVAGSLTFVGVTLLIGLVASLWAPLGLLAIVAVALILGAIEGLFGFGVDNLVLPPIAVLAWRAIGAD
jgi:dolichol kinase